MYKTNILYSWLGSEGFHKCCVYESQDTQQVNGNVMPANRGTERECQQPTHRNGQGERSDVGKNISYQSFHTSVLPDGVILCVLSTIVS